MTSVADDGRVKTYSDRTGILIVRLWIEGDVIAGFRAHVTQTNDSLGLDQGMSTAGTPDDLYTVVRLWVEGFIKPV